MKNYQITEWLHHFIQQQVQPGDYCIDATMGNGHDTCLLSSLAGINGKILAFDIQPQALENTARRLQEQNCPHNYQLFLTSHEYMEQYAQPDSISCITFNFGYLPGGDHSKATKPESSLTAIEAGLRLLKRDGLMTLAVYSGGDSGFEEKNAILKYIKELNAQKYLVIQSEYINRPNHPPTPILIWRVK